MGRTRLPISWLAFWKRTRPEPAPPSTSPPAASSPQQDESPAPAGGMALNCPGCLTANPEGARFCSSCGSPLTTTCPNCGTGLVGGGKFLRELRPSVGARGGRLRPGPTPAIHSQRAAGKAGSRPDQRGHARRTPGGDHALLRCRRLHRRRRETGPRGVGRDHKRRPSAT